MPSSVVDWESSDDDDDDDDDSSVDEDQTNARLSPHWPDYRALILSDGYRLDTVRDVREHYQRYGGRLSGPHVVSDDNALCKDPGLPENLFRATCCTTNRSVIVKAVHRLSREVQNVRYISSRHDPMNHSIPVLSIIDVPADGTCFIVMEAWSSHLLPEMPASLRDFVSTIRQCIQHIVFMHRNRMAHLDISLHNFLTDYHGKCACIDYELSRMVDDTTCSETRWPNGTEVPPECEQGQPCNPYMIDVWALAILILRACRIVGLYVPELLHLTRPMLHHNPDKRPSAMAVLREFERLVSLMGEERLDRPC